MCLLLICPAFKIGFFTVFPKIGELLFGFGGLSVPESSHGHDLGDLQTADVVLGPLEGGFQPVHIHSFAGKTVEILLIELQTLCQIACQIGLVQPTGIDDLIQLADGAAGIVHIVFSQIIGTAVCGIQSPDRELLRLGTGGEGGQGGIEITVSGVAVGQVAAQDGGTVGILLQSSGDIPVVGYEFLWVQFHVQITQIPGVFHAGQNISQNPGRKIADTEHQHGADQGNEEGVSCIPEPDDDGNENGEDHNNGGCDPAASECTNQGKRLLSMMFYYTEGRASLQDGSKILYIAQSRIFRQISHLFLLSGINSDITPFSIL